MAKPRHHIDYLFRQHLPDYEATNSTGNWDLLNHMLNEQERKRRNRKWFLLILSFSALLFLSWMAIKSDKTELATGQTKGIAQKSNTTERPDDGILNKKREENIESLQDSVSRNQQISSPQTLLNFIDKIEAEKTPDIVLENNNSKAIVPDHDAKVKAEQSINPGIAINDNSPRIDLIDSNVLKPATTIKDTLARTLPNAHRPDDSLHKVNHHTAVSTLQEERNNLHGSSADSVPLNAGTPDSLTLANVDSPIVELNSPDQITVAEPTFYPFNVYAGVNNYNTSEAFTSKRNFAPLIGIEYTHRFSQRWLIGMGAWYSPQGGYKLKDTSTQETFFFDHVVSQQAIHIHRLHKLYFPLSIYYKLSNAHVMGIGIQPSYLLNTTGNYIEIHHSTTSNSRSEDTNVNGYIDGIKPVTFAMHVAYKYKLSKSLDFGVRLSHELTSAYESEYFYGINTKPTWGLQAQIHFNF